MYYVIGSLSQHSEAIRVQSDESKQQNGESPKRRASIAEEREGNSDDGSKSDGHSDVYCDVEEQNGSHPVAINA